VRAQELDTFKCNHFLASLAAELVLLITVITNCISVIKLFPLTRLSTSIFIYSVSVRVLYMCLSQKVSTTYFFKLMQQQLRMWRSIIFPRSPPLFITLSAMVYNHLYVLRTKCFCWVTSHACTDPLTSWLLQIGGLLRHLWVNERGDSPKSLHQVYMGDASAFQSAVARGFQQFRE
jgi:hypothetical protein